MSAELPEVILTTTSSVDGRISLGRHQRLLDPAVWARWGAIADSAPFTDRHDRLDVGAILEGSGSLVDIDAIAPDWPAPSLPDDELYRDHLPPHGAALVRGCRRQGPGRVAVHGRR